MAADTTPPESLIVPLTPPLTEKKALSASARRTLDLFRRHREGDRPQSWLQVRLTRNEYTQVSRILGIDRPLGRYVKDKIRYDYDPCRSCLTIRMPTPLHDTFCAKLVNEISGQLKQFQEDGEVATFAREVEHFATSRILIPEDAEGGERRYIRREPDASFGHRRAQYPGVIIEVCYSQKRRQISRLADDYILNTDGSVNVVVCLDIDYKGSKKATISVWRPEYVTIDGVEEFRTSAVVEAQAFRTAAGRPAANTGLRLFLKDFGTVELTNGHPYLEHEILVSSEQLCEFLSSAEARQRQEVQGIPQGSVNKMRPGARKRRRPSTPLDGTDAEDESEPENRKSKRGRHDSSDYRSGSLSGD